MRVGVKRTAAGAFADPAGLVALAQAVEELGFQSFWLGDQLCFPQEQTSVHPGDPWPTHPQQDFLEALSTAGFLLAKTQRLPVGVNCMVAPYRNPLLAAKTIASLDHLSEGRVRLALGAGWMHEVFAPLGAPPFASRGKALEEYVDVLRTIWREEVPSFDGEFYGFPPTYFRPRLHARRAMSIMIAGNSATAFRRILRLRSGWSAPRLTVAQFTAAFARFQAVAEEQGTPLDDVENSVIANLRYEDSASDAGYLTGTPEQVRAAAAAYAAAGAKEVHVNPVAPSVAAAIRDLERFRRDAEGIPGLEFA